MAEELTDTAKPGQRLESASGIGCGKKSSPGMVASASTAEHRQIWRYITLYHFSVVERTSERTW